MRLFVRAFMCASLICAAFGAPVAAQTPVLQILDHIHLNVPDPAKGVEWYQKNFGGAPMTEAPDRLMFGDTRLITTEPRPLRLASGTTVNFSYFEDPVGAKIEMVQR
jgi:hypothetical protein